MTDTAVDGLRYQRVLLKLSGEVFQDKEAGECLDGRVFASIAASLKQVHDQGAQIGLVVGGGNIFRGALGEGGGVERNTGDLMGMLATLINSLALHAALEKVGAPALVMSALPMGAAVKSFNEREAVAAMEQGKVVIFGAGTGNPFFTTDSAAALRACQIHANALLKATKVDGIYSADPVKDPSAVRFDEITYAEALEKRLKVMDATAFSLCMDNNVPIIVFNFFQECAILDILRGEKIGTLVR